MSKFLLTAFWVVVAVLVVTFFALFVTGIVNGA